MSRLIVVSNRVQPPSAKGDETVGGLAMALSFSRSSWGTLVYPVLACVTIGVLIGTLHYHARRLRSARETVRVLLFQPVLQDSAPCVCSVDALARGAGRSLDYDG